MEEGEIQKCHKCGNGEFVIDGDQSGFPMFNGPNSMKVDQSSSVPFHLYVKCNKCFQPFPYKIGTLGPTLTLTIHCKPLK